MTRQDKSVQSDEKNGEKNSEKNRTHTKLFKYHDTSRIIENRVSLDDQINTHAIIYKSKIIQVSMVSYHMSTTLSALVVFEDEAQ
tara:strand:- start:1549 stop:1803 length:255 start_codon:yes stop_codon:yes gene_type:complete